MTEKESPILRIPPATLRKMLETGEAKIVSPHEAGSERIITEFKSRTHTPDIYERMFNWVWKERLKKLQGEKPEITFSVQPCPYSTDEIKALEKHGRRLAYLPEELCTQEGRKLFTIIWPEMKSNSLKDYIVTNGKNRYGWFDYETTIDVPNEKKTLLELRKLALRRSQHGMNLNEYIIASQDSKLLTGSYLDEEVSWTRLFGSYIGDSVVNAYFSPTGSVFLFPEGTPDQSIERYGGRLVGTKK